MEGGAPISVTESVGCDETLRPLRSDRGIVELDLRPGTAMEGPAWYEFARGRFGLPEFLRSLRGPRRSPAPSSGEPSREAGFCGAISCRGGS